MLDFSSARNGDAIGGGALIRAAPLGADGQLGFTQVSSLGPEWTFEGTGDFFGNGNAGFLVKNTNGALVVGEVSNGATTFSQIGGLGFEWAFKGTGDFFGDGASEFLIENTTGALVVGEVGPVGRLSTGRSAVWAPNGSSWATEISSETESRIS